VIFGCNGIGAFKFCLTLQTWKGHLPHESWWKIYNGFTITIWKVSRLNQYPNALAYAWGNDAVYIVRHVKTNIEATLTQLDLREYGHNMSHLYLSQVYALLGILDWLSTWTHSSGAALTELDLRTGLRYILTITLEQELSPLFQIYNTYGEPHKSHSKSKVFEPVRFLVLCCHILRLHKRQVVILGRSQSKLFPHFFSSKRSGENKSSKSCRFTTQDSTEAPVSNTDQQVALTGQRLTITRDQELIGVALHQTKTAITRSWH